MVSIIHIFNDSLIIQLPILVNEIETSPATKAGKKLFDVRGIICYNSAYCPFPMGKPQNSAPAESSEGEDSQALSPPSAFFLRSGGRGS